MFSVPIEKQLLRKSVLPGRHNEGTLRNAPTAVYQDPTTSKFNILSMCEG